MDDFKFYSFEKILDFLGIKYEFEKEKGAKDYPYNRGAENIEFMYGYIIIPRYGIEQIVQNKISDKEFGNILKEIPMLVNIPFICEGKPGVITTNVSLGFRYDKTYKYGDITKSIEEVCYAITTHGKVTNDFFIIDDDYFGEFMSNYVMDNQWGIGRSLVETSFTRRFTHDFRELSDEEMQELKANKEESKCTKTVSKQ